MLKLSLLSAVVALSACDQVNELPDAAKAAEKPTTLKVAKRLSTDASVVAADTHQFLLQAQHTLSQLDPQAPEQFDEQIFQPVNRLLTRWRLEVKQSDSVVGDQLTICRGALVSFDAWARSVMASSSSATAKQTVYQRQQQLCQRALQS